MKKGREWNWNYLGISLFSLIILFLFPFPCCKSEESSGLPKGRPVKKKIHYIHNHESLDKLAYLDLLLVKNLQVLLRKTTLPNQIPILSDTSRAVVEKYVADFEKGWTQNWALDLDKEESWLRTKAKKTTNNPIAAFRLLWRILRILPLIQNRIEKEGEQFSALMYLKSLVKPKYNLPSENDLSDAIKGLLRISTFHQLEAQKVASGKIMGVSTGAKLNAVHCLEIGTFAYEKKNPVSSIEWLKLALEKVTRENDDSASEHVISQKLNQVISSQADHQLDPSEKKVLQNEEVQNEKTQSQKEAKKLEKIDLEQRFQRLCAKKNVQTEEAKSKLFCWLEFKINVYYAIGPLKMEFLSQDPDIVQFYEVLGSREIREMHLFANGSFDRGSSVVYSKKNGFISKITQQREAADAKRKRFNETFGNIPIPKRIQMMTRLSTDPEKIIKNDDEQLLFRIASYTFAGIFKPHLDSSVFKRMNNSEDETGDRIALVIFYLNTVKRGGRTAFLQAGVTAKPIKGSAVLAFHLLGHGVMDETLLHASCPVVLGRKIIGRKQLDYYSQFHHFKCPLDKGQRFQVPVNGKFI